MEDQEIPEDRWKFLRYSLTPDQAYQNAMKNSDRENARIEHDSALQRVMTSLLADHAELFKQFSDDQNFQKWLTDSVFTLTYDEAR